MSKATVFRDHRGTKGAIDDADAQGTDKSKTSPTHKSPTVSASDAIKNERVGSKGERSFGTPIKDNQTTDSNNE